MAAPQRDSFIDALRGGAVLVVVVGHWLAASVVEDAGRLTGLNALTDIPESHLATWMLQVMPLLFFVGGFANARSLARHDAAYLAFVRTRLIRLLAPTVGFVVIWLAVGWVAEVFELPEVVVAIADLAGLPFWFLGVYIIVISLAPWLWSLHRRFGWRVVGVSVVGSVAVDVAVHGAGWEVVGVLNFVFVWLLPHQLGYLHADGALRPAARQAAALAALGLGGLIVLTTLVGYPVSLIAVPGADRFNTNPPSLAIVAVTAWLVGLALVARPLISRWAYRRRAVVRAVNSVPLTLYLWHVAAAAIAAVVLDHLGFPRPEVGTGAWWALRIPWLIAIVPVMAVVVVAVRRLEIHPRPRAAEVQEQRIRHLAVGIGVVSVGFGILGFGVTGFDNLTTEFGGRVLVFEMNPLQNLLHVAIGAGLLWVAVRLPGAAGAVAVVTAAYLAIGLAGWTEGIGWLAMNPATAVFHVVLAALSLGLFLPAIVADARG